MEVENRLCCRPQCCPGFFNLLKTMKFWNGICAIVIFLLVILHMVCIGGPYFSGLLINGHTLKEISSAVSDAANESYDSSDSMSQFSETMTFGLWEMCIYTSNNSVDASDCITWGTTSSLLETPTTITIGGWIHGVQALAIIGTLFAGFGPIFAFFSLICESRDDRQRFCFLIISALCIIGGIAMLIGDIIMGVMYKTILESVVEGVPLESDMDVPATLIDLLKDKMYLSWGFTSDICCSGVAMLYGIVIVIIIKGELISKIAPSGDGPERSSSQTPLKECINDDAASGVAPGVTQDTSV